METNEEQASHEYILRMCSETITALAQLRNTIESGVKKENIYPNESFCACVALLCSITQYGCMQLQAFHARCAAIVHKARQERTQH